MNPTRRSGTAFQLCRWGEDDQLTIHGLRSFVLGNQNRKARRIHKSEFSHVKGDVADPLSAQGSQLLVEQTDTRSVELSGKYHQGMCADTSNFGFQEYCASVRAPSREIRRAIAYTCSLLVDPAFE